MAISKEKQAAMNEKAALLRPVILQVMSNQLEIGNSAVANDDKDLPAKIVARIYHDRLLGINKAIYDESLSLFERVQPYLTNANDDLYARAMAFRFSIDLDLNDAKQYDILKFTKLGGDVRIELNGDNLYNFIIYLRSIGGTNNAGKLSPAYDGINHINVYSSGNTTVGRLSSNFAAKDGPYSTLDGDFKSLEGYYHWLRVAEYLTRDGGDFDLIESVTPELKSLRSVEGVEAIRLGRKIKAIVYGGTNYHPKALRADIVKRFKWALCDKLDKVTIDGVSLGLKLSSLHYGGFKLVHYYVNADHEPIFPKHGEWLPELIIEIVSELDPYGDRATASNTLAKIKQDTEQC